MNRKTLLHTSPPLIAEVGHMTYVRLICLNESPLWGSLGNWENITFSKKKNCRYQWILLFFFFLPIKPNKGWIYSSHIMILWEKPENKMTVDDINSLYPVQGGTGWENESPWICKYYSNLKNRILFECLKSRNRLW